jgi:hypothetical protein
MAAPPVATLYHLKKLPDPDAVSVVLPPEQIAVVPDTVGAAGGVFTVMVTAVRALAQPPAILSST